MPFFSIIIPVFNVAEYLPQCLKSVSDQSFPDFEIIAINDGSTDDSLDVLLEFSRNESRILLFDRDNQGLSRTRNFGVSQAAGQYIVFLDSDDYLSPDALLEMKTLIQTHQLDVIMFSATAFFDGAESRSCNYQRPEIITSSVMSGQTYFTQSIIKNAFHVSACLYAVKASISRSLSFYPDVYFEDNLYTTQLLFHPECSRVMATGLCIYYRRIRPGSITTSYMGEKHVNDLNTIFNQLVLFRTSMPRMQSLTAKAYNKFLLRILRESFYALHKSKNSLSANERFYYIQQAFVHCPTYKAFLFIIQLAAPSLYSHADHLAATFCKSRR